jgi:uncharacterized protein
MERTPLDVVRDIYAALARRDLDAVTEFLDPGIEVTQDSALPWGGHYVGRDGFGEFAVALVSNIDSTVTVESMFQAGDAVVQHGRTAGTVRATGTAFDISECHIWTIREGRAVEARFFIDSAAMLQALAA